MAVFSAVAITGAFSGLECLADVAMVVYQDPVTHQSVEVTDPNEKLDGGYTHLMRAADAGDCAAVEGLLEMGADVRAKADDGTTALLIAAQKGCLDACVVMLEKGAEPDARTAYGETPLLAASSGGHLEIVRRLFSVGADVLVVADNGVTALHFASASGNMAHVRMIFELARTRSGELGLTPEEHARNIAQYVDHGDWNGWTPLMNAAWNGNAELVRMLLDMGADPGVRDKRGNTARMMAVRNNKPEVEKILLDAEKAAIP